MISVLVPPRFGSKLRFEPELFRTESIYAKVRPEPNFTTRLRFRLMRRAMRMRSDALFYLTDV